MDEPVEASVGRRAAKGSLWATGSNLGGRLIAFCTTMVMARLLTPADFGIVAIGLITIGLLDSVRNLGVGEALIVRQKPGDTDSNTAFWIAVVIGICLTVIALGFSPVAAGFFNDPDATRVIAVLSVVFIIEALMVTHATRAQRDFQFDKRAYAEITKALVKAAVSIGFAVAGFGFWSLVFGQIAGALAGSVAMWWLIKWRPAFEFDRTAAKGLISYGGALIALGFVAYGVGRSDQFMIGRHLDTTQLGFYAIAFTMVDLLIANPARTIGQASFSAFSRLSGDTDRLRRAFLEVTTFVSLLCVALGVGLFLTAANVVDVLLTSKWLPAVPVMQALAFFAIAHAVSYPAGDVLKALGRANSLTQIMLVWLVIAIPVLWYVAPDGIVNVAWVMVVFQGFAGVAMILLTMQKLKISIVEIVDAMLPAFLAGLAMCLMLLALEYVLPLSLQPVFDLMLQIVIGAVVYLGVVRMVRPEIFGRLSDLLLSR